MEIITGIVLVICYFGIAFNLKERSFLRGFVFLMIMTLMCGMLFYGMLLQNEQIEELKEKLEEKQEFEMLDFPIYKKKDL